MRDTLCILHREQVFACILALRISNVFILFYFSDFAAPEVNADIMSRKICKKKKRGGGCLHISNEPTNWENISQTRLRKIQERVRGVEK